MAVLEWNYFSLSLTYSLHLMKNLKYWFCCKIFQTNSILIISHFNIAYIPSLKSVKTEKNHNFTSSYLSFSLSVVHLKKNELLIILPFLPPRDCLFLWFFFFFLLSPSLTIVIYFSRPMRFFRKSHETLCVVCAKKRLPSLCEVVKWSDSIAICVYWPSNWWLTKLCDSYWLLVRNIFFSLSKSFVL